MTGSPYGALVVLQLVAAQADLASQRLVCVCLPRDGVKGVHHHARHKTELKQIVPSSLRQDCWEGKLTCLAVSSHQNPTFVQLYQLCKPVRQKRGSIM